jgi:hypothetical protein
MMRASVQSDVLRIIERLERRAAAASDMDDMKAAILLRLLLAVWQTEQRADAGDSGVR